QWPVYLGLAIEGRHRRHAQPWRSLLVHRCQFRTQECRRHGNGETSGRSGDVDDVEVTFDVWQSRVEAVQQPAQTQFNYLFDTGVAGRRFDRFDHDHVEVPELADCDFEEFRNGLRTVQINVLSVNAMP